MATSSNCSAFAVVPALGYPVTEKLARNNHALWKAQVQSALKGARVGHYLDKANVPPPKKVPKAADKPDNLIPNPDYDAWIAIRQGSADTQLSMCCPRFLGRSWCKLLRFHLCCGLGGHRRDVCISILCPDHQHAHVTGHCAKRGVHHC
jgi:hypothetical protein